MKKLAKFVVEKRIFIFTFFLLLAIASIFLMGLVKENYDFSLYLSDKTETRKALKVMEEEFGTFSSVNVMVNHIPEAEAGSVKQALSNVPGVGYIQMQTEPARNAALYGINFDLSTGKKEADIVAALRAALKGKEYYMTGGSITNEKLKNEITMQMPLIMLIAVAIVIAVLLLTSRSYLEPLLILIVIFVAILINMGTNAIFGTISYITKAVAAILQLALAMDYSIIFIHKFYLNQDNGAGDKEAVMLALSQSFSAIASSALTTVAGLSALMFMSFRIGFDIGMVLSKGIVISMLTVFFLMPGLLYALRKPLKKLRHKPLNLKGGALGSYALKTKNFMPIILVLIIAAGAVLQTGNVYTFSNFVTSAGSAEIAETFGRSNQLALLYPVSVSKEEESGFLTDLNKDQQLHDSLQEILSWNALTMSAAELAVELNIPEEFAGRLVEMMGGSAGVISVKAFYEQLALYGGSVLQMPLPVAKLALLMDLEDTAMIERLQAACGLPEPASMGAWFGALGESRLDAASISAVFEVSPIVAGLLLAAMGALKEGASVFEIVSAYQNGLIPESVLTEQQKALFDRILPLKALDVVGMDAAVTDALKRGYQMLNGEQYNRMILVLDMADEGEDTAHIIEWIKQTADAHFGKDNYLAGESVSYYDISKTFSSDLILINLFTVLAIFLIIALTFRSLSVPLILVLLIQGAIWITLGISALMHQPIFFMSYIICVCIQMGATIDYGIIVTSNYRSARTNLGKAEALKQAMAYSLPTILTSGTIFIAAGFVIGLVSTVMPISSIGMLLGRGTVISVILILGLLPSLLYIFDRFLVPKRQKGQQAASVGDTAAVQPPEEVPVAEDANEYSLEDDFET